MLVTLVVGPLFQVLYLTAIGTTIEHDPRTMAGVALSSSLLITATAAVESIAVVLTSDRNSATLSYVMLSALPRAVVWVGRSRWPAQSDLLQARSGFALPS
ncbi:MAG: hypothetical protein ACRDTC_05790 [Pseudonocardiaceae bacterium]